MTPFDLFVVHSQIFFNIYFSNLFDEIRFYLIEIVASSSHAKSFSYVCLYMYQLNFEYYMLIDYLFGVLMDMII